MRRDLTQRRIWAARMLAAAADLLQIVVFPAFLEGVTSPVNDALDLSVGVLMIALLGWHWALLPAFAAELVPVFDLFPTWTAAVFFATRGGPASAPPALVPPKALN